MAAGGSCWPTQSPREKYVPILTEKCYELGIEFDQRAFDRLMVSLSAWDMGVVDAFVSKCDKPFGVLGETSLLECAMKVSSKGSDLQSVMSLVPTVPEHEPRTVISGKIFRHIARTIKQQNIERTPQQTPEHFMNLAQEIERGIFNFVIQDCQANGDSIMRSWADPAFVSHYSARAGVILDHLNPESEVVAKYGPKLVHDILQKRVAPSKVGSLKAIDLCPEAFKAEAEVINLRKKQIVVKKETTMWRCPQCGERKSTYWEVQDRSADEAPSIYCMCSVCHTRFKAA